MRLRAKEVAPCSSPPSSSSAKEQRLGLGEMFAFGCCDIAGAGVRALMALRARGDDEGERLIRVEYALTLFEDGEKEEEQHYRRHDKIKNNAFAQQLVHNYWSSSTPHEV